MRSLRVGVAVCAIGLVALGCLAGLLLRRTLQDQPQALPRMAAQTIAPPSGNRIWIPVGRDNVASPVQPEAVLSVLNIPGHMHFGSFVWDEDHVPGGRVWMRIDLTNQLMSVFRGGHEIGTAVILYGADGKATPVGSFTILEKDAHHISRSYDAPMPYMLRLTNDGVAIHGSDVRKGWATHGCIGVPLDFARLLFAASNKGDLVIILPRPVDDNTRASRVGSNRKADVR